MKLYPRIAQNILGSPYIGFMSLNTIPSLGKLFINARDKVEISLAVVNCPRFGKPDAFLKIVLL